MLNILEKIATFLFAVSSGFSVILFSDICERLFHKKPHEKYRAIYFVLLLIFGSFYSDFLPEFKICVSFLFSALFYIFLFT